MAKTGQDLQRFRFHTTSKVLIIHREIDFRFVQVGVRTHCNHNKMILSSANRAYEYTYIYIYIYIYIRVVSAVLLNQMLE